MTAGDRVAIYMPMVPEALISMLACARLGLTHSVVFAGFSSGALRSRVDDAQAKLVITTDGQYRRGKPAPLKTAVDEALGTGDDAAESVEKVLVVRRTNHDENLPWVDGRDVWWEDTVAEQSPEHTPEPSTPNTRCFCSTPRARPANPRASCTPRAATSPSVLHLSLLFDHKEGRDVFWCGADIGWVTGHSYLVYGPLSNGATEVVYEAPPTPPTSTATSRSSKNTASPSITSRRH